jgi:hypothetical protein
MLMKKFLLFSFLLITGLASAQKFSIKGQLLDTLGGPLPSATVLLLSPKDSSLVNFSVSDAQGNFEIKNVAKGEHLFKVTFMGMRPHTQKITLSDGPLAVEIGKIKLEPIASQLEAIEIAADRAPVTVKRDTIEFNAGSFKTKQNAMVEDLLKKLPGVEVDNDGNITAQGEQVRQVTVDGKNFFGRDPKIATKNLPADAVNKVQVFDKKSDQTAFSGIDDGQREKTINLELKEEKRNGAFGNIFAGVGTDDRYQARASINRFTKKKQFSVLAMANNVNEQGFSMEEYMNFTGGSQQMMGGGGVRLEFSSENQNGVPLNFGNRANGLMTNYAGGINLNNSFTKKTDLNSSYFFNYLEHDRDQSTLRENFLPQDAGLPSRNFTFNQNSRQHNTNVNHRVNATLDHKLDSMNSLKLTTTATYNETDMNLTSSSQTLTPEGFVQNTGDRYSVSSGSSANLSTSLLWRHKFNKKGRTFSTNLQYGLTEGDRDGFLNAQNHFFAPKDSISNVQQINSQQTSYRSYGTTLSYTEPLGKRRYLEANYSYRTNLNDVDREVYDVNNGENVFNTTLSNKYNSDYQYHRAGLNYRVVRNNFNLVLGGSMQRTSLQGELELLSAKIDRSFENILPTVRFNYDFSNSKHLRFDYETSVQEPSIQQLQPVVDNSDPLNIYRGNPNLRPAYSQSWRTSYMAFNPATFINFFGMVDVDYVTNAIVNAQTVDENLVRTTKPVNVSNSLRMNSNLNFGFPINKIGSRFNFGANYRGDRSMALLNDRENQINQSSLGGNFRYTYRYKEIFDLSLSARVDKQLTDYEFNQADQSFLNQTYTAESNLTFLKNFQFSGNLEYLMYESQTTNFKQEIPLLNLSLSRYVLKNKVGEIKLSVNNLLDKALGVNQTATINYFERTVTNSLGRYYMLSFTYALNKQLNPMGMRRGGGNMMRVIR